MDKNVFMSAGMGTIFLVKKTNVHILIELCTCNSMLQIAISCQNNKRYTTTSYWNPS